MDKNINKKLFFYLFITFAITWGAFTIIIIANQFGLLEYGSIGSFLLIGPCIGCAPAIGTAVTQKKYGEITSLKEFFQQIFRIKPVKKTLGIIVFFFIFQALFFMLCGSYNGTPLYLVFALLPFMMIGGGFEEVGWRGYLQPLLEKKLSFIPAALCVGIIWAVWHLPLWFINGSNQRVNWNYGIFTIFCIVHSFALALLYKLTQNVFSCILHHAWLNVLLEFIVINFKAVGVIFPLLLELVLVLLVYYLFVKKNKNNTTGASEVCLK